MKKYYDQHTHSSFSPDSKEDLRNYFLKAKELGIEYVSTCEHFDYQTNVDGSTWIADYDELIKYHNVLSKEFPEVKPLLGVELGYKKISYNEMIKLANKYPFDIIQLSLHENDKYDYYYKEAFKDDPDKAMVECLDLTYEAIERFDNFDVLSHIDFGFKTLKLIDNTKEFSSYDDQIKKIFQLLIKKCKSLEVNTKVQEIIYNIDQDNHHINYLLKTYYDLGGRKITLSSDAHTLNKYLSSFDKYAQIILNNGFNELSYYIKRTEYHFDIKRILQN